ncbi:glucosaminidase domain-containing protein [Saccharospirillum mangrovi]|uniref:glucosaminidase domain-containing protein n=1 Tax=Saccharospirillum mangrovi TaxID=2161747 RepID=UPI000D367890|nr:glucosaminidase domain-containing protein [Saccharospirillum mangrovi]
MRLLHPRAYWLVLSLLGLGWPVQASDLALLDSALPDLTEVVDVAEKKAQFLDYLAPRVKAENHRIEAERAWLTLMREQANDGVPYEPWQAALLARLGAYYEIDFEPGTDAYFTHMLHRVDTLPVSLVLAQAAKESGWGTSRFAVEGNNLFGQWCFSEGCGLVPSGRPDGERYEVKAFDTVAQAVSAYFRNVNTHDPYLPLRNIRAELRYLSVPLESDTLAWGLERYSTRGEAYIREISDLIDYNDLKQYDLPAFYALN